MITWRRAEVRLGAESDFPGHKNDTIVVDDGEHEYFTRAYVPLNIALRDFISGYRGTGRRLIATSLTSHNTEVFDLDQERERTTENALPSLS